MYPLVETPSPPVVATEAIAVAVSAGTTSPSIGLVDRTSLVLHPDGQEPGTRQDFSVWFDREDGKLALRRLVLEEGWVNLRSEPGLGDLLEVSPFSIAPVIAPEKTPNVRA